MIDKQIDDLLKKIKYLEEPQKRAQQNAALALNQGLDFSNETRRFSQTGPSKAAKQALDEFIVGQKDAAKAAKSAESEFAKLSKTIDEQYLASLRSLSPEYSRLTKSEKDFVALVNARGSAWDKLSPKEQEEIRRTVQRTAANERAAAAMKKADDARRVLPLAARCAECFQSRSRKPRRKRPTARPEPNSLSSP